MIVKEFSWFYEVGDLVVRISWIFWGMYEFLLVSKHLAKGAWNQKLATFPRILVNVVFFVQAHRIAWLPPPKHQQKLLDAQRTPKMFCLFFLNLKFSIQ